MRRREKRAAQKSEINGVLIAKQTFRASRDSNLGSRDSVPKKRDLSRQELRLKRGILESRTWKSSTRLVSEIVPPSFSPLPMGSRSKGISEEEEQKEPIFFHFELN